MIKVALITPGFGKPGTWGRPTVAEKKAIKEFTAKQYSNSYSVSANIEQLLLKLNTAKSYDDIPETIKFAYSELIQRNIDSKEVYDVVNLTARLAATKFNEKPKDILFTGFAGRRVFEDSEYKKLTSAGFVGCSLSPLIYGIEAAEESMYCTKKDPSYWCPAALTNKSIVTAAKSSINKLEIALTFRQEQILKMICSHGMTNRQIAKRLDLSESTVKMHIGLILKKYAVQDRTQLIFSLKEKIG